MSIGDKARAYVAEREQAEADAAAAKAQAAAERLARIEAQADAETAALEADTDLGFGEAAPETPAPVPVMGAALTFEQMKELFQAAQGSRVTDAQIADIAANAAMKAKMPENKQAPLISVYSHPEGERDHPKAKLKCRMYFGSSPIEAITCTPSEIDSLNSLTPGLYRVKKTDGSTAVVEVQGQVNANRDIERLVILLPAADEGKNNYGPTLSYLTDQCADATRVSQGGFA